MSISDSVHLSTERIPLDDETKTNEVRFVSLRWRDGSYNPLTYQFHRSYRAKTSLK